MDELGITLSALEEDILTLLLGKQAYGLQIVNAICQLSHGCRAGAQGTFYPLFKRLEDKYLIASSWGDADTGARRKYYRITDQGLAALQAKQAYRDRLRHWLV